MTEWNLIIKANGPAVWRTLFRVLGSRADADECFQDVFVEAVKTARRREIRNWPSYLQKLGVSRAIDQLRRRRKMRVVLAPERVECVVSAEPGVAEQAQFAELSEQLRQALARLPGMQAEAISLNLLNGWSYEEIASELGVSVSNVGVLIHRGRERLRELLEAKIGVSSGGAA